MSYQNDDWKYFMKIHRVARAQFLNNSVTKEISDLQVTLPLYVWKDLEFKVKCITCGKLCLFIQEKRLYLERNEQCTYVFLYSDVYTTLLNCIWILSFDFHNLVMLMNTHCYVQIIVVLVDFRHIAGVFNVVKAENFQSLKMWTTRKSNKHEVFDTNCIEKYFPINIREVVRVFSRHAPEQQRVVCPPIISIVTWCDECF